MSKVSTGFIGISRKTTISEVFILLAAFCAVFFCSAISAATAEEGTHLFSLEFRDMDVKDVLRVLARESGENIVIPHTITGKVTLSLDKITLNDALDVILKSHGLSYVSEKGVIRVVKPTDAEVQGEELLTEILTVNYAKASDLMNQVKGVLSSRGSVSVDVRTNVLVVKDTGARIDDARNIIRKLDSRTPQVLIEARIIEANSNFSRSLGIQWGGRYSADGNTYTGGAALQSAPSGNKFAVNLPATGATGGIGMSIGSITSNLVLDVQLSAAEKAGDIKIVSTPKITTVNNKPAMVSSGVEFSVKTTNIAGGAETTQGTTSVSAKTTLSVTPQISSDDSVLLSIQASRDEPDFSTLVDGIPGIVRKNASTTVLVKDGETTVIGGLYRNSRGVSETRVPYLSRIPILGWLFKSRDRIEQNEELLIFITPRIIRNG